MRSLEWLDSMARERANNMLQLAQQVFAMMVALGLRFVPPLASRFGQFW